MMLGLAFIVAVFLLLVLASQLCETRVELARVRQERDQYARSLTLALLPPVPYGQDERQDQ